MNTTPDQHWNAVVGPTWARLEEKLDRQLGDVGRRVMDTLGVTPGDRVLDVGCGAGRTTIELARRVAPSGRVTGVDISAVLLDTARANAAREGVAIEWLLGDAATTPLGRARFDVLYSRFGVMFFEDPGAAFAHLRGALAPGGRLGFVCWRGRDENPWAAAPLAAASRYVAAPMVVAGEPGPFAFADGDRVRGILGGAGFASVAVEPWDLSLTLGGNLDLDAATDFLLEVGPTATALRLAGGEPRDLVRAAVRECLASHVTPAGVVMPGAVWIATARATR